MKKYFHFPLSYEDLMNFCHPREGHYYEFPFMFGNGVAACNGWIALSVDSYVDCELELNEAESRVKLLPWDAWKEGLDEQPAERWGVVDDRRGGKAVNGKDQFWEAVSLTKWKANTGEDNGWMVQVGHHQNIIPCPIMQLIGRLPRAEVYLRNYRDDLLPFRFNGGKGFAKCLDVPATKWKLWQESRDLALEKMSIAQKI